MNDYKANEVLVDESGSSGDSDLLIREMPLLVSPTIATKLGLNEAIVLQQLHVSAEEEPLSIAGHNWYTNRTTNGNNNISRSGLSKPFRGFSKNLNGNC